MSHFTPYWLDDCLIYQIHTGRWDIPGATNNGWHALQKLDWQQIKQLGFKAVYLLGAWDTTGNIYVQSEEGVDLSQHHQRTPSMFAITDHTKLRPELGSLSDFQNFLDTLHQIDLKVILDYVPNHTGLHNQWIVDHPEYYYWENNDLVKEFSGDVAKLNYQNPQLRQAMLDVLDHIVQLGVDAVRCDMAHLIPLEFWQQASQQCKTDKPDFVFIAEAYAENIFDYSPHNQLLQHGFDAIYDAGYYKNINQVIIDHAPLTHLAQHLNAIPRVVDGLTVNYLGNHDDPPLQNRTNDPEISQTFQIYFEALLAITLFGSKNIKLFYNGTLHGQASRLAHHWQDMLPAANNELITPIDANTQTWFRYFQAVSHLRDTDQQIHAEYDRQLFTINIPLIDGQALVIANCLQSDIVIDSPKYNLPGLIHHYKIGDSILPGTAELYINHD